MADDPKLREMTCDPKFRKVLVTDGKTAVGQAVVAGAGRRPVPTSSGSAMPSRGRSSRHRRHRRAAAGDAGAARCDRTRSVTELAGEIGGKVDIVVNTAEHPPRAAASSAARGIEVARAEMDVNYFGAAAAGAGVRARAARARRRRPDQRRRLGQPAVDLRAGELPGTRHLLGRRRRPPFAGAVPARRDAPGAACGGQRVPRPDRRRVEPAAAAAQARADGARRGDRAALRDGVEDVYPGDVAQEWLARWRDNPKVLERELGLTRDRHA